MVRAAPVTRNRYVFVGTGKLLGMTDIGQRQVNTFYALRDGTRLAPFVVATLPSGLSFPLVRGKLVQNPDLLQPILPDAAKQGGWFYELPNIGERVVVDAADTDVGKISWLGSIPDGNNPCEPTASARIYATNFETGQSQLFQPDVLGALSNVRITSYNPLVGIVGLKLVRVDGNIRAVMSGHQGEIRLSQALLRYLNPRAMNWREITDGGM